MLSNRRRRFALHAVCQRNDTVELGWLAKQVRGGTGHLNRGDRIRRSQVVLRHAATEPPSADGEVGIIEINERTGTVYPTSAARELGIYLEVVPRREVSWHGYYLGLRAVSIALLVALWVNAPPFTALPDTARIAFVVVTLVVSAVHAHFARCRKLGGDGPLPEVRR